MAAQRLKRVLAGNWSGLRGASLGSLALRMLGMAVSFVLGVLLARFLGPEGFGLYGVVIALALLLSVVAQIGLPALATRELSVALPRREWGTLRAVTGTFALVTLATGTFLAVVLGLVILVAPSLFGRGAEAYFLGATLIPLFALTVLVSAQIRALGAVVRGQSLEVLVRPLLNALFCLGLILGAGAISATQALAANVTASVLALLVGAFWLRNLLPHDARTAKPLRRPREWTRSAVPLALFDNLRQVDASYAMLLLGMLSADSEAGFFRVAYSTILVVMTPLSVLHVVLAPTLAKLSSDKDYAGLRRLLALSAVIMSASMAVALALLLTLGKPLVILVFGEAYASAWLPLTLLTAVQGISGFFGVGWVLLSMGGGERDLTLSYVVSIPLSVTAAVPLIAIFGANGAAVAAIGGAAIQNLIVWRAVKRRFGLDCSVLGALSRKPA